MSTVLYALGALACIVTLTILIFGIRGFGAGKMTPHQQNKVMRWRIIAQFTAVVILVAAVYIAKGGS